MFTLLFSQVSDNCHCHRTTRHVFAFEGFCGARRKLLDKSSNPGRCSRFGIGAEVILGFVCSVKTPFQPPAIRAVRLYRNRGIGVGAVTIIRSIGH